MVRRDERTWLLRDVLAAAKEEPISQHSKDEEGTYILAPKTLPVPPTLIGNPFTHYGTACTCSPQFYYSHPGQDKKKVLDIAYELGLPKWMTIGASRALFSAIKTATTGDDPTLTWKEPISIATGLEMTIVDAQQRPDAPRHLVKVILRSRPAFQNRWYLNATFH